MVMDYALDQSILLLSWRLSVDLYSSIKANTCNRDASHKNIEQVIGFFFFGYFQYCSILRRSDSDLTVGYVFLERSSQGEAVR
jgi:hypothetical protein